jgi:hypothetical protein
MPGASRANSEVDGDASRRQVDVLHLAQHHLGVLLPAYRVPDRWGNIPFGQYAGRDLVQQRLKQVMVGPVNDGDVDLSAAQ